jgi:hypothetical protein
MAQRITDEPCRPIIPSGESTTALRDGGGDLVGQGLRPRVEHHAEDFHGVDDAQVAADIGHAGGIDA